jgi:hypothetical protein
MNNVFDYVNNLSIMKIMLALFIISFGILSRVVIHAANFTPVLSLAFLGGMYLKGRQAVLVPLALMIISDFIIGFHDVMFFTWGSIVLISVLGLWLKERKNVLNVLSGSIISAVFFFMVTNFGAWLTLYPHTIDGLRQCYILAIPFFRGTFISTIVYSLAFYVTYEWALKRSQGTALARLL